MGKLDILKGLNAEQKKPVKHINGPIYVIAAPGAGKTRVMINRIAYMIASGIDPSGIMIFTFTRKASREITERLKKYVGNDADYVTVGTYHSICARMLRRYADRLGYDRSFTIIDPDDQKKILKEACKGSALKIQDVANQISKWKSVLLTPSEVNKLINQQDQKAEYVRIYIKYQKELKKQDIMDFDDLIFNMIQIMTKHKDVQDEIHKRYPYILVDEFQDSSMSDIIFIQLMTGPKKNLCVVLDDEQCWDENGIVQTSKGAKKIKDLSVGDMALTVQNGKGLYSPVTHKSPPMNGRKKIKITTESGEELIVTPDHKMFVTKPEFEDDVRYVYMMYRQDKGFRIGMMSGGKSKNMHTRAHTEKAERIWILGRYENRSTASYYKQYYSLKYQIPVAPYFHKGRGLLSDQSTLDLVFDNFRMNGERLLEDLSMNFDNPNYVSQGTARNSSSRSNINIMMNGSKNSTIVRFEKEGETIRKQFSTYSEALEFAKELYKEKDAAIIREQYRFKNRESLGVFPASQLSVGMSIPVVQIGNEHSLERIVAIESVESESSVYHVEVKKTGILVVNNIVSHNSIYQFRGSNIDAVLDTIEKAYPFTKYILSTNYRSTNSIVEASRSLICNNKKQVQKTVKANKPEGFPIVYYEENNAFDEANKVVKIIKSLVSGQNLRYNEIAILYRSNFLSRAIEDALLKNSIPYKIAGGLSFYDRAEIKDLMSFFRLLENPHDEQAFKRIVNIPKRGMGEKTIKKILSFHDGENTILDACKKAELKGARKKGVDSFIKDFEELCENYETQEPQEVLQNIIKKIDYNTYLSSSYPSDYEEKMENVEELLLISGAYLESSEFVSSISLNYINSEKDDQEAIHLLTMHASKGLEYKSVIIVGVNEGIIPHSMSSSTEKEVEEERRLMYVAMTRAEELLFITRSKLTNRRGFVMNSSPSRFINEIDKEWLLYE